MSGVTLGDGLKVAARVLSSKRRPMLAHLVVSRYCNLECAYCSEFDKVSKPVPLPDLMARIDALARLGTQIVTLTGGEPLTHPDHDAIIARIRHHKMVATTIELDENSILQPTGGGANVSITVVNTDAVYGTGV